MGIRSIGRDVRIGDLIGREVRPGDRIGRTIARVRPGDLIRAEDFNYILDQLEELDERVAKLEAPRIDRISPESPFAFEEMEILGRNFGVSAGAASVSFDSIPVSLKAGSNDSRLLVDVPFFSVKPVWVVLRVSNGTQWAERKVLVSSPHFAARGSVDLQYLGPDPRTPQPVPGGRFVLMFALTAQTDSRVSLNLSASVEGQKWDELVSVVDGKGRHIDAVTLEPKGTARVLVELDIPKEATGARFAVGLSAVGDGVEAEAAAKFAVEQPVTSKEAVQLDLTDTFGSAKASDSTVSLPPGADGGIIILATFRQPGTYEIVHSDASGWDITLNPAARKDLVIPQKEVARGVAQRKFSIDLRAPKQKTRPQSLVVTLAQRDKDLTYDLALRLVNTGTATPVRPQGPR